MSKTKISEYSSTAANNTDVQNIFIGEGMLPSDVNNAMRAIMAHLKNFQAGLSGDSITVAGDISVGGNASITGTLDVSADTAINSTGALKVPVGQTAQRPTGADGKLRYNSDTKKYEGYADGAWANIGTGGATGGGTDEVFNLNTMEVTTTYELPAGKNAMSVGAITINSGVSVTVPSGQRWVIL